jgi:Carboxypeptidase regulatory-like domain
MCRNILSRALGIRAVLIGVSVLVSSGSSWGQAQPPVVGQNSGTTRSTRGISGATTRSIGGTVLDAANQPIAGAIVLLKNTKSLQVRSYIAQPDGSYRFYGLSTEINYQLRAQAKGMTSKTKTVSVFDSHKVVKLDLKINRKLKS